MRTAMHTTRQKKIHCIILSNNLSLFILFNIFILSASKICINIKEVLVR